MTNTDINYEVMKPLECISSSWSSLLPDGLKTAYSVLLLYHVFSLSSPVPSSLLKESFVFHN